MYNSCFFCLESYGLAHCAPCRMQSFTDFCNFMKFDTIFLKFATVYES